MRSAPTLKIWITPFSSVAMLEKLALLKIAFCKAPVFSRASLRRTSVATLSLPAAVPGMAESWTCADTSQPPSQLLTRLPPPNVAKTSLRAGEKNSRVFPSSQQTCQQGRQAGSGRSEARAHPSSPRRRGSGRAARRFRYLIAVWITVAIIPVIPLRTAALLAELDEGPVMIRQVEPVDVIFAIVPIVVVLVVPVIDSDLHASLLRHRIGQNCGRHRKGSN